MRERIKPFSWISLICCIVTIVMLIVAPTLITAICCGGCSGLFVADTIWRNAYNEDDESEEDEYRCEKEECDEDEDEC